MYEVYIYISDLRKINASFRRLEFIFSIYLTQTMLMNNLFWQSYLCHPAFPVFIARYKRLVLINGTIDMLPIFPYDCSN